MISRPRFAAVALALVFLALHLPFLPASLEDLDSINFALGVREFDVARHQPHPPGYPLFIAAGKIAHALVPSEAKALALVSIVAGSLSVFALMALFRRLAPEECRPGFALTATLIAGTAPMFWVTASRPLSDMAGLAAAVGIQAATLAASSTGAIALASFLAALGTGIRTQVAWLTVPLIALVVARRPRTGRWRDLGVAALAFAVGVLTWAIPLVALTGGPSAYWHALSNQGAEDLSGIEMLWTTPTPRQLLVALNSLLVAPWASLVVAAIVILLATVGLLLLLRRNRRALASLAVAFIPYLIFDLLFQESVTTRYALPIVVPLAYLAASGLTFVGAMPAVAVGVALAMFDAHVGGTTLAGYASAPAPAFRLLADMRESSASAQARMRGDRNAADDEAPVLAMHRREDLDLRRPIVWLADAMPRFSERLSAPPKREWLQVVNYLKGGRRRPVWFVADPLRTDLALIDRRDAWVARYRWPLDHHELIGGVRPDVMDWYRFRAPSWFLGEGWALTPETAGVAAEEGRGPSRAPIEGWIRRRHEPATLLLGGRNLGAMGGPAARVRATIDGQSVFDQEVAPGYFLRLIPLPSGALDGDGEYATVLVSAGSSGSANARIAIEQFDLQSANRVVFGLGEGWYEHEYNPRLGLEWHWMSERGLLRVHAGGHPLLVTIRGEAPSVYFQKPSRVRVSAGGQVVFEDSFSSALEIRARVPAELVPGGESSIAIETDQTYVPAERSRRSPDRRHLGLRVFACDVTAAPQ